MSSPYSESDMKAMRQALAEQLEAVTEQMRNGLSESEQHQFNAILGQAAGDSSDEALATSLGDLSAARIDHEMRRWRELKDAERRIEAAGFGECVECGGTIPAARMIANPAALRCIACQTRFEHTHAGHARGSL